MLKLKLFIFLALIFASTMYDMQAMTQDDLPGTPDTPESIRDASHHSSLSSFNNSPTPPRTLNQQSENKNAMIASPTQTDNDRPARSRIQHFRIQIDAPPAKDLEALFYRACEGNDLHDARRALLDYHDNAWIIGEGLKKATNPAIRDLLLKQLISTATELESDNHQKRRIIARLSEENIELAQENAQLKATKKAAKKDSKCVIL